MIDGVCGMNYWIFQGNPRHKDKDDRYFDVTKYVLEEDVLTWEVRQKHYVNQIKTDDLVFIWRADGNQKGSGGIIAKGIVVSDVRFNVEKDVNQVEVKVIERKVTPEAGMILRSELKQDIVLSELQIIKQPSGTNFKLSDEEFTLLEQVWNKTRGIIKKENCSFYPSLSEYDPDITVNQFEELLLNESVVKRSWLDTLYFLYQKGGEGTCKQISIKYGNTPQHYNRHAINIAKAIHNEIDCKLYLNKDNKTTYWPILFYGKELRSSNEGEFIWKLREPLLEAIQSMNKKGIFECMKDEQEFFYNTILYGPPGTGKTYHSVLYAVAICDQIKIETLKAKPYEEVLSRYHQLKDEGRICFTTFHQSYGYEEFIEGIQPLITDHEAGEIKYCYKNGIFKRFCQTAQCSLSTSQPKPYVFIIDEINRGNVSKIFGELITLIEATKRLGMSEEMTVSLPYTGDSFGVPNNVYLLGTMNTADRSIALMDTALRRRFNFIEMLPDSKVLEEIGIGSITINDETLNLVNLLELMNRRIEYLFDREHMIGHAFFTPLKKDPTLGRLATIFEKSIIPLLQEYFYEDYEKIQLVLGDNAKEDQYKFILDEPLRVREIFSGHPDLDLPDKKYNIQRSAFYYLQSYKKIGVGV